MTTTHANPAVARRRIIRPDVAIAATLLVLFTVAFAVTFSWPEAAARFPRAASAVGILFSVSVLVVAALRTGGPAHLAAGEHAPEDPDDTEYIYATAGAGAWLRALGWSAGYLLLVVAYGLFIASGVFALAYIRWCGRRGWLFSIVYAVVLVIVLLASFRWFVYVSVPEGFIHFA